MATFIVEGRLCARCFLKPLHSSTFTHHHASTSQRVSIQRLRTYLFHSFKATTEPDDIFYNETQTMSDQPADGDSDNDSTIVPDDATIVPDRSSPDEDYDYEHEDDDVFGLERPWDGHLHLVLVNVDNTQLVFAITNWAIGTKLEVIKRLFIFHRYHANWVINRSSSGPLIISSERIPKLTVSTFITPELALAS